MSERKLVLERGAGGCRFSKSALCNSGDLEKRLEEEAVCGTGFPRLNWVVECDEFV